MIATAGLKTSTAVKLPFMPSVMVIRNLYNSNCRTEDQCGWKTSIYAFNDGHKESVYQIYIKLTTLGPKIQLFNAHVHLHYYIL